MIKKLLVLTISFTTAFLFAQDLPILLDINKGQKKNNEALTFKEKTQVLENYFSTLNIEKKGSGYKPFKRWEYHWSHYLQEDGNIAPVKHLWKAWEEKRKMSKVSLKATSNWTDKGPFDQSSKSGQGRINTVVVDPNNSNIIYAGAPAGGLWKSTNSGVNWTVLTDNLPQIGVSGIAIDPNNSNVIYISTGDDDAGDSYSIGVLKSVDGGNTFNQTGVISFRSISSNEIVIDPEDSNKIWVANDQGLYLSTNAGASWTRKQTGNIRDFKLKPGDSNTIYSVTGNAFFKSVDGGTSFENISTGLPSLNALGRYRVEVTPAAPNNVYLLAAKTSAQNYAFDGIYISTNNGVSFTKTGQDNDIFDGSTQAWYDLAFSVSNTDPNTMFVGVLNIWGSTDGGNNFNRVSNIRGNSKYVHVDIHFMRYYNGVLYAGTDGGVYRSTNNGATFTDLTQDMSISQFYKVTVSRQNSNKLAGGLQDNGGFAFSNNIWNNYHGGDGMDAASDPNDENTFYGFTQFGGFLSVTTDGGLTSTGVAQSPSSGNWVTPLVINKSGEVYAGYSRVHRLENNEWFGISNSFGSSLNELEIDPSNNDIIFASRGTTLYKSTDRGKTFTTLPETSTGISGRRITSIEVHNSNSNIIWITSSGVNFSGPSSGFTGGGVFKSTNGGLTFTDIGAGLPNEAKFVVRHHPFTTNNSIYIGTALGVYHRNDDTDAWEVFSTNLPNVAVSDLEINPYDNTITAATYGRSVWQSPIPTITLPNIEADLAKVKSANNTEVLGCGDFTFTPSITVNNNGQNTLTSFAVNYNLDGGTNRTLNWTGIIQSNESLVIDLNPYTVSTEGNYKVNAEVVLANDANNINNSNSSASFNLTQNLGGVGQTTYTFGDVNPTTSQDPTEWTVSNSGLWQIGAPSTSDLPAGIASAYVTNPSGNYPDQTTAILPSPCYNLSILENPVLKFDMAFDLEQNWDIIYMEYSTDMGSTWNVLGTSSDPNWYNSNRTNASSGPANDCQNCPGAQWTGTDGTLKQYSYNLSALNSETNILFRFKFQSDQSVNEEGVVIDNFIIDASAVLNVNDFEKGEFLIFPNPSKDIFNIKRTTTIGEDMNVKVYDITGKLIRSKSNIVKENYKLDMSNVATGIYFLEVSIDTKRLVQKLILN